MHPFILQNLAFLTTLYEARDRYYHNLTHIKCMNAEAMRARNESSEFNLVADYEWASLELAIWFHDAVYDAQAQQVDMGYSERASAELFRLLAEERRVYEPVSLVTQMIRATAHHLDDFTDGHPGFSFTSQNGGENCTQLIHLMLDIDLASLGYDYKTFHVNTMNVRREYYTPSYSNAKEVLLGNGEFLRKLLRSRKTIFYTEHFRSRYEDKARFNISKLLTEDAKTLESYVV